MLLLIFVILMTSFLMYVFILNICLHQLLVCPLLCFLLFVVCLSSYTPRRQFLSKALVYCFLEFRRIGGYISLDLFCFARPFIVSLSWTFSLDAMSVVICWLVDCMVIKLRVQHSDGCDLPHLVATDISRRQWTCSITCFESFVLSPPAFRSLAIL